MHHVFFATLLFAITAFAAKPAIAEGMKRPFYVIAHRANSMQAVTDALKRGVNAVEIDVRCSRPVEFYVNHTSLYGVRISLDDFLSGLARIAARESRLSLAVFDVKTVCGNPRNIVRVMRAIREHLPRNVNALVAASNFGQLPIALAAGLADGQALRLNEAVAISRGNDQGGVSQAFFNAGIHRFAFANGIFAGCPCPWIWAAVDRSIANAIRDRGQDGPRFVYVWTVAGKTDLQRYVTMGVDGIIVDPASTAVLLEVLSDTPQVRLATRRDRPFAGSRRR